MDSYITRAADDLSNHEKLFVQGSDTTCATLP